MSVIRRLARSRSVSIALGLLAAGSLVIGARALTTTILSPDATLVGDAVVAVSGSTTTSTAGTTRTNETTSVTTTARVSETTTTAGAGVEVPETAGDLIIGEPIIEPREPISFVDRVTAHHSVMSGFPAPVERAPTGGAGGTGSGTGLVDRPDVTSDEVAPLPRAFNVGVTVEPENHFAVIRVGIDAGPAGLSELSVDFGDGEVLEVSQGRIDQVGDIGTIEIIHRYQPTLTPQPQQVIATATDGGDVVKVASARFETQSEFLLGYSPLTITALDDCDRFGKGDFELDWNNDGREKSSHFDLGKGDRQVEGEFRAGIDDLRYGDQISLTLKMRERDPAAVEILRGFTTFSIADALTNADLDLFVEVMEFGTHTVPIDFEYDVRNGCDALFDFSVTLGLSERSPG